MAVEAKLAAAVTIDNDAVVHVAGDDRVADEEVGLVNEHAAAVGRGGVVDNGNVLQTAGCAAGAELPAVLSLVLPARVTLLR